MNVLTRPRARFGANARPRASSQSRHFSARMRVAARANALGTKPIPLRFRRSSLSRARRFRVNAGGDDDERYARIAAVALETIWSKPSRSSSLATSTSTTDDARRMRLTLASMDARRRAREVCARLGSSSPSCVDANEDARAIQDALARASANSSSSDDARALDDGVHARVRDARAMDERVRRDPLAGVAPCRKDGECDVARGTLRARQTLMRRFDFDDDDERESERGRTGRRVSAEEVGDAVRRATALCASEASKEACAVAWGEVEELSNWGASTATDWT